MRRSSYQALRARLEAAENDLAGLQLTLTHRMQGYGEARESAAASRLTLMAARAAHRLEREWLKRQLEDERNRPRGFATLRRVWWWVAFPFMGWP